MPIANVNTRSIESRRIFRLALGTSLALVFGQIVSWPLAYVTGILTLILLGKPSPAPTLKKAIGFVAILIIPLGISALVLMPLFEFARWSGILLLLLALFGNFYFTASGGNKILGLFMLMGLALITVIGSVSIDGLLIVIQSMALCAGSSMFFVWIAHICIPELPVPKQAVSSPHSPPSSEQALYGAVRSLIIIIPVTLFLLFSSASAGYLPLMLKVVIMGQQVSSLESRNVGFEQVESTLWGGLGAILAWQIMSIWPSLLLYGLLMALAGLLFATKMFNGIGTSAKTDMWSFAFLTMIIILTPALADSQLSNGADAAFYTRLALFIIIGLYGWFAVVVYDAFFPVKQKRSSEIVNS